MATLGSILVRLDANITGLNRGLAQAGAAVRLWSSQTRQSLAEIDRAFMSLGKMTAGVGTALGSALLVAADRAAEAGRNLAVLQVVAAKNSVDFDKLSSALDEVAGQFGLTGRQAQGAATTLIRSGATLEQTAALLQAAGASALLAGFDVQQAWDNVATAVVTGRSELLETSGIISNLGPAQQAYAQSVGKTVEELTDQERIQANTAAILNETRTEVELVGTATAGYTGEVAKLRAGLDELVVEIGQEVLPTMATLVGRLNEFVVVLRATSPETRATATDMAEMVSAAGLVAGGLIAARAAVTTFGGTVAALGKGLLTLVRNPLTAVIAALVQFGRGFIEASSVTIPWLDIMARVGDVVIGTGQALMALVQIFGILLQAIGMLVGTGFMALVESMQAIPQSLGVIEAWAGALAGIFSELMGGIAQFGTAFKELMSGDIVAAGQAARAGVDQMGELINGGLAAITEPARQATANFADAAIIEPWSQAISNLDLAPLNEAIAGVGEQFKEGGARIRLAFDTSVASPLTSSITSMVEESRQKFMQFQEGLSVLTGGTGPASSGLGNLAQNTDWANAALGETPAKATAAAAAVDQTKEAASGAATELERLTAAVNAMGENLPSGLTKLGADLDTVGAGSTNTANAIESLASKAASGTNALDEFDRQIIEVGQSLAAGLINPEEADVLVAQLRAMQAEAQGIKAQEDATNKALRDQQALRQQQTQLTQQLAQEQSEALGQMRQLQSDINALVAEQGSLYGQLTGDTEKQTRGLSAGDKYLADQLQKIEGMREAAQDLYQYLPAAALEAKAALADAEKQARAIAREIERMPRPGGNVAATFTLGGYQVPLQDEIAEASRAGLTAGLTAASQGEDWARALQNALTQGVMDAVISGFTEALASTGIFKQLRLTLGSALSSSLQESLDRVNQVNRGELNQQALQNAQFLGMFPGQSLPGGSGGPRPFASGGGGQLSQYYQQLTAAQTAGFGGPNLGPMDFFDMGGSLNVAGGIPGGTMFSPLAGVDSAEEISNFFDQFMETAGQTIDELKPLFEQLGGLFADDTGEKLKKSLSAAVSGSIGSALNAAMGGDNWQMTLRQNMYNSVLEGLTSSLNEQLIGRYSGLIESITNSIMAGSTHAIENAFEQVDNLTESLADKLEDAMAVVAEVGAQLQADIEAATRPLQELEAFQTTVAGGLQAGITAFLEGSQSWQGDLKEAFRQSLLQGMVEAILNKGIVEGLLSPVVEGINAAIVAGNMQAAADLVAQFMGETVPQIEGTLGQVLAPLYGALAPVAENPDLAAGATAAAAGGQIDITGPQYQDPAISNASDTQMAASETFADAVGNFQTAVTGLGGTGPGGAMAALPGVTTGGTLPVEEFSAAVQEFAVAVRSLRSGGQIQQTATTPNRGLI